MSHREETSPADTWSLETNETIINIVQETKLRIALVRDYHQHSTRDDHQYRTRDYIKNSTCKRLPSAQHKRRSSVSHKRLH